MTQICNLAHAQYDILSATVALRPDYCLLLQSWEKWMMRKLTGRSYGSLLKEKLRSCEIQLQILEEEETRLLRLIEQRDNEKSRQEGDET